MTTASQIAAMVGGVLEGDDVDVVGVCSLASPRPHRLFFVKEWAASSIALAATHTDGLALVPAVGKPPLVISHIVVDNPRLAFAQAVDRYFNQRPSGTIANTAIVHPSVTIGAGVTIGHFTVVGEGCVIGDGCEIRNHVSLHANVEMGERCLVKSGAVLGEEGFGIETDDDGNNVRLPHSGGVVLGKEVEVGANTVISGGTIDPTRVGDHTKIDDHVFIAHNVQIGRNCIVIAMAEVSGSVTLGDNAWLAPACTIINGVSIGENALVGIGAVITKAVEPNAIMGGARATFIRHKDSH